MGRGGQRDQHRFTIVRQMYPQDDQHDHCSAFRLYTEQTADRLNIHHTSHSRDVDNLAVTRQKDLGSQCAVHFDTENVFFTEPHVDEQSKYGKTGKIKMFLIRMTQAIRKCYGPALGVYHS